MNLTIKHHSPDGQFQTIEHWATENGKAIQLIGDTSNPLYNEIEEDDRILTPNDGDLFLIALAEHINENSSYLEGELN